MNCKVVTHWDGVLHILRNPHGFPEEVVRQARLDAADRIEALTSRVRELERQIERLESQIVEDQ